MLWEYGCGIIFIDLCEWFEISNQGSGLSLPGRQYLFLLDLGPSQSAYFRKCNVALFIVPSEDPEFDALRPLRCSVDLRVRNSLNQRLGG
jgi:hypothetical protein